MTYHSAKGLDFETVFLPRLDEYTEINQDENLARRLFYVAATRSRRTLSITHSSDRPHTLLQGLPAELLEKITISSRSQTESEESNIDNIF
jgi:superfamily I DNA/RNA helicase